MNFSTFTGFIGGTGRNQVASQTLATATETEFKVNTDNGSGAIAVLSIPTGTGIGGSNNPLGPDVNQALLWQTGRQALPFGSARPSHNAQSFDFDRPFLIRLAGVITPASNAGNTYKTTLYLGSTKSGVALTNVTAAAQNASVAPFGFILEAQLHWDSSAQVVLGQYWYDFNGTTRQYSTWITTTNPTTATAATVTSLNFCATSTWGNAVGGVSAVSEFSISQL